jgi:hypothetical protein
MQHGNPVDGYAAAVKRDETQNPCNSVLMLFLEWIRAYPKLSKSKSDFFASPYG